MATSAKPQYFQYQNGNRATMPQKDMEITQDMHLKMSKKIAQLTKVKYHVFGSNQTIKIGFVRFFALSKVYVVAVRLGYRDFIVMNLGCLTL